VLIVRDMVIPNCVWSAGRTAAAVRKAAMACLWALLRSQLLTNNQVWLHSSTCHLAVVSRYLARQANDIRAIKSADFITWFYRPIFSVKIQQPSSTAKFIVHAIPDDFVGHHLYKSLPIFCRLIKSADKISRFYYSSVIGSMLPIILTLSSWILALCGPSDLWNRPNPFSDLMP